MTGEICKAGDGVCLNVWLSSCFYIFIPLCTPPPHCPPLGICFCSSEEAHASSVWTQQQLSVPSSTKHVRRCLLEVALAQQREEAEGVERGGETE
ncbi:uncharacterized [Tachysurus ichikawai]